MEAVTWQITVDGFAQWLVFITWPQIFEVTGISASESVMYARRTGNDAQVAFALAPIEEVVAKITMDQPDVVFAPHVETSSGVILPDSYIKVDTDVMHAYGGLLVLVCIASGCAWVDMRATGVDLLISAPQKG